MPSLISFIFLIATFLLPSTFARLLATGLNSVYSIQSGGQVFVWGRNTNGQLGLGSTTNVFTPTLVPTLSSVTDVGGGNTHGCFVNGGGLKCAGANAAGQIGNSVTSADVTSPTQVTGLTSDVARVDCGGTHTCALTTGGGLSCWGNNGGGQLGIGSAVNQNSPQGVTGFSASGVADFTCGVRHTCLVTTAGAAKCAGKDAYGQLGYQSSTSDQTTMVDVFGLGDGTTSAIFARLGTHTCALLTGSNGVRCWGRNNVGQLGDGSTTNSDVPMTPTGLGVSGIASVNCGPSATIPIFSSTNNVEICGTNTFGQFGNGGTTSSSTLVTFGQGNTDNVEVASGGFSHVCVQYLISGAVQCAGADDSGQLGDGGGAVNSNVLVNAIGSAPTKTPTFMPTLMPTLLPTSEPTKLPTSEPTKLPTSEPTLLPTSEPTKLPTSEPTKLPTSEPTLLPTSEPTKLPTIEPTKLPTKLPTETPTESPTTTVSVPTKEPTVAPSAPPTINPTLLPTLLPTSLPTVLPTLLPTREPTLLPTKLPTTEPSQSPTQTGATSGPTRLPTILPTIAPSKLPTLEPTKLPTLLPTLAPSKLPTLLPTLAPSKLPTLLPTLAPSKLPTLLPTAAPTMPTTKVPTFSPTLPTTAPTKLPTVATNSTNSTSSFALDSYRSSCTTVLALIIVVLAAMF